MDKSTILMAMTAMSDNNAIARDVAKRLGITTTTLYEYINGDGTPKESAYKILQQELLT